MDKLKEIQSKIAEMKKEQLLLEEQAANIIDQEGGEASYTIRPAGRHVLTIGEELIQDQCAALVELVKNAYDADSRDVNIAIIKNNDDITISVIDHGHGMSSRDIAEKWLVPSTENKKNNRKSPSGRIMQGRKGIGRYAASILGNSFVMKTSTADGIENTVSINWSEFAEVQYLDQVKINVVSEKTDKDPGTSIVIVSNGEESAYWNEKKIDKLKFELKKLIAPKEIMGQLDKFDIVLTVEGFGDIDIKEEKLEAFPIMQFYDYRISGTINSDGKGCLKYETQKIQNAIVETIELDMNEETGCGDLSFDIRVYDRDRSSIEGLINRGLKDPISGRYLTQLEAKQLLNKVNGIGVYRNGFRIRPLGDPEYDWLLLNKTRVQSPSRKIGSDQAVGYVQIQSEELSGLEEKSARDGLKENYAYERLKSITNQVISELETRRFTLRRKLGETREQDKIEKKLNGLYDYTELKKSVDNLLIKENVSNESVEAINKLINEEERKNNQAVEDIRNAIAVYQGQATLGKIINIVLHEGRKPLNYFKNQRDNLEYYHKKFLSNHDDKYADKMLEITDGYDRNGDIFARLFSRLDPLASKKRDTRKVFFAKKMFTDVVAVFEHELKDCSITVEINCSEDRKFYGWEQDFYTVFTNLLDNSIYWINHAGSDKKEITITVEDEQFLIDYQDSGPGISQELIESGVIYEPEFSTKPDGTGLGLAIAGEAAERNSLDLRAIWSESGAHFTLQRKEN